MNAGRRRAKGAAPPVHLSRVGAAGKEEKMQSRIIVVAAILTGLLLASCREEEQGHPYVLDKGNYTGKIDNQLTQAQLSELNNRIFLQGTGGASAGAAERPQEERPAPQNLDLQKRLQEQSGQ
jgi:hypothetical protein